MSLKELREIGAYFVVSTISVGAAAYLSLQFLNPVFSEEGQQGEVAEVPPEQPAEMVQVEEQGSSQQDPGQNQTDLPTEPQIANELMMGESPAQEDLGPRPKFPTAEEVGTATSARELEVFLEPYIYDAGQRRNPFETFAEVTSERGVPLSPLQKFPLNDLTLLGIMWDIRTPKAMFVDPNSIVHVVGRDEGIGQKNGYVAAIREGEVVVVEAERKESGIVYETKILRLPR